MGCVLMMLSPDKRFREIRKRKRNDFQRSGEVAWNLGKGFLSLLLLFSNVRNWACVIWNSTESIALRIPYSAHCNETLY